jgi:hypothetical protein
MSIFLAVSFPAYFYDFLSVLVSEILIILNLFLILGPFFIWFFYVGYFFEEKKKVALAAVLDLFKLLLD